jgi:hypothetical protein
VVTREVSAAEYGKTYDCKTPGCVNEVRSTTGRHAYCKDCQVRRGTRRPDGSVISTRIPAAPGARGRRSVVGPFETRAAELVPVAREVDSILFEIKEAQDAAKQRLPAAYRLWRETLERIGSMNGAPAVADVAHAGDGSRAVK